MSRHIEHSELTEETLNDRAFYKAERIEDIVSESIEYKQLHRAVSEHKPVVGSEQGGIRPVLIISNDKRFLPAMDKVLAISIGLNGYSQCPMKQGSLSASLPAHECCPLHDDSVQKKD